MFKCQQCSRSYAWEQSLKRHIKLDHSEESSEAEETGRETTDDSEDSDNGNEPAAKSRRLNSKDDRDYDNEDDDEAIWIAIVEKIVNEHKLQYDEKLLQNTELVEEEMRLVYKRALKNFITEQIIREIHLQKSKYYAKLIQDFRAFVKRRPKLTLLRAVRTTLRQNDNLLDDILDDFDDNIRRHSLNENQSNDIDLAEGQ